MPLPPAIILTNDDGFDAPGLQHLAQALIDAFEVPLYIAAPKRCYSGGSQQVTMSNPIPVEELGPNRWAIGGSPADCVRLALTHLARPDAFVVSGINHGGNMGHDIFLSGTVGAAHEAALLGAAAVAVSHYLRPGIPLDWPRAATWTVEVLRGLFAEDAPAGTLWNVNLPHHEPGPRPTPEIRPSVPCPAPLPIGYTFDGAAWHYDGGRYHTRTRTPGTDVDTCFGGDIALSRLQAFQA